jgi:hypothetical protein
MKTRPDPDRVPKTMRFASSDSGCAVRLLTFMQIGLLAWAMLMWVDITDKRLKRLEETANVTNGETHGIRSDLVPSWVYDWLDNEN